MNTIIVGGFKAFSFQRKYLNDPARFVIVEGATKIGKTYPFAYKLSKHAFREGNAHNQKYWWVGPISSQSKIAYERLSIKYSKSEEFKCVSSPGNMSITRLSTGCRIEFKSADRPDGLYGEDVVEAVCDEITRWSPRSWSAVYSTLTATNGSADLIGNFVGSFSWVHLLAQKQKNNPDWSYHRIPFTYAVRDGLRTQEQLDRAKADTDDLTYKRLYLCEDVQADNQILSVSDISLFLDNPNAVRGSMYLTADLAMQGADKFTLWVWDGWRVIDCRVLTKTDGKEIEALIRLLCENYNIPLQHVCYDADGLGSYLEGYMKQAVGFHNGATPIKQKREKVNYKNLKAQTQHKFAQVIKSGIAGIACDLSEHEQHIAEELAYIRNTMKGNDGKFTLPKKVDIKSELGRSPDYLDGLSLRAYFELEHYVGGSVVD